MSEDQFTKLQSAVERIERGLFGDHDLKLPGIAGTQQDHERRLKRIERTVVYLTGAAGCAVLVWTIWSQWPRK